MVPERVASHMLTSQVTRMHESTKTGQDRDRILRPASSAGSSKRQLIMPLSTTYFFAACNSCNEWACFLTL